MKTKRERQQYQKDWYEKNKTKHKAQSIANNQQIKKDAILFYGGKCACCGEEILDFLCIDHVNNDGNIHRKELKHHNGGTRFYYWLRRSEYPEGFQVLCHNCNFSKHINKGVCVHKLRKDGGEVERNGL